jgi:nicotinate-nucleotide adenylyltransferase
MTDGGKRVAVFGGSFNPPHLGHAFVTTWALAICPLDEVWWVPTFSHAFGKALTPFERRAEWCRLATRHVDAARVCLVEGEMQGESRTIDTLEELSRRHPDHVFSLLIGADLVPTLPRWKRSNDLLSRYPIHVVGRGALGAPGNPLSLPDISSTEVRRALAMGDRALAAGWMDRAVLEAVASDAFQGDKATE